MLALGQLQADRGDKAGARAELEQALPLLKAPRRRRADDAHAARALPRSQGLRRRQALPRGARQDGGRLALRQGRARARAPRARRVRARRGRVPRGGQGRRRRQPRARAGAARSRAGARQAEEDGRGARDAEARARGRRQRRGRARRDPPDHDRRLPRRGQARRAHRACSRPSSGGDFQRLAMLGALYEETGDVDKAIATYRKALAVDGKQIDVRLKLVHLLQTAGELDTAIKEYEALIKAAPEQPRTSSSSSATRSSSAATGPRRSSSSQELEARAPATRTSSPPSPTSTSASRRRTRRSRCCRSSPGRRRRPAAPRRSRRPLLPGRRQEARARDLGAHQDRRAEPRQGRGHARRGVPRPRHDRRGARRAARGGAARARRTCATRRRSPPALERTATSLGSPPMRYGEARAIWEELLAGAGAPTRSSRARRARTSSSLWALTRELARAGRRRSRSRFAATPPDLEAGRLLAEVQRKLHRLPEAEATLRRVVALAPGDEESLLALERVLVQEQNLARRHRGARQARRGRPQARPRVLPAHGRSTRPSSTTTTTPSSTRRAPSSSRPTTPSGHQKLGEMYKRRAGHAPRHRRVPPRHRPERPALPRVLRARRAAALDRAGRRGRPALPPRRARLRRRGAGRPRRAHEHAGEPRQGHARRARARAAAGRRRQPAEEHLPAAPRRALRGDDLPARAEAHAAPSPRGARGGRRARRARAGSARAR